ncbi:MAG: DUF4157 domain-containing protein [Spirulina sp. SIO3F2]|nr:DUF4157 domain-containing protein [Spirulina sp. SIO3F2]
MSQTAKRQTKPRPKAAIPNPKTTAKPSPRNTESLNLGAGALMDNVRTVSQGRTPVQAKLTIGQVGDQYEQEADHVAAQVVQQLNQPKVAQAAPNQQTLQTKPNGQQTAPLGGGGVGSELEIEIKQAQGHGHALDSKLQRSMGQAMGAHFGHVAVHNDARSHQLNQALQAKAFTTGNDVFFGKGQYQPQSKTGQTLIAHELTHTLQQGAVPVQRQVDTVIQCKGSGAKIKAWWEGLFTKEPKKKCSASKQQGIKYLNACKKYPPFSKWQLSDFIALNERGNIKITDQTRFEIFAYYCESEYSTENSNIMLLISKMNWLDSHQLMAVAELMPEGISSKTFRGSLPKVNYPCGKLPDNVNLSSKITKSLIAGISNLDAALKAKDKSEIMKCHMALGDTIGVASQEAYRLAKDTMFRFIKTLPEGLFPDAAALLADLKKIKGGAMKGKIMSGLTESEDLEYAEAKKKQQEEIAEQM